MGVRARRRSGTGAYRSTRVAAGAAGRRLGRRGAIGARRGAAPLRGDAAIVDPLLVRGLVGKSFLERLGLRACLAGGRRRGRVRRAQLRKEQQGQGGGAKHAAISVFAPGTLASGGGKSGPAAKGSDSAKGTESSGSFSPSSAVPSQDSSKVQGLLVNKSATSERAPGEKSS